VREPCTPARAAASLLTGGAYPTISDSVYVDLNVKYAK
jgi:hypothetical protein